MNNHNNHNNHNSITSNNIPDIHSEMFYMILPNPNPNPTQHVRTEEIYLDSQRQWGQFVDIESKYIEVPPKRKNKKHPWISNCNSIKEHDLAEVIEDIEPWNDSVNRMTICISPFTFIVGKLVEYLIYTVGFLDTPSTITNTVEPHPL